MWKDVLHKLLCSVALELCFGQVRKRKVLVIRVLENDAPKSLMEEVELSKQNAIKLWFCFGDPSSRECFEKGNTNCRNCLDELKLAQENISQSSS